MLQTIAAWAAAHPDFLAAVGLVLCSIVPQDGSGGDFEFFGSE